MPTDFQNANTVLNVSCVPSEGGQESIESYDSMLRSCVLVRARAASRAGVSHTWACVTECMRACLYSCVCLSVTRGRRL